ncbi:MAG: type II toxin-antitoxin system RelE/ParE family toxin [Geminicoccaceae bacterium]
MRIFATRWFARFARREGIAAADLREAVRRIERGLVDADLGGRVVKQRISRPHAGKSGGFRSIVIFRAGRRAIFVYGFATSARATIRPDELLGFKRLAAEMLGYDDAALAKTLASGALEEVGFDEQGLSK